LTLGIDRYEFSPGGGAGVAGDIAVLPGSSGSGGSSAAVGGGLPTRGVAGNESLSAIQGQGCVIGSARIAVCTLE
jgi:hypothetical protein